MTKRVGIREFVRNSKILDEYDYIDIEDKKTHEYKGLFISAKYADEFKKLIEARIKQEREKELDVIRRFAGKGEVYKRFEGLTSSQIREKIAKEKYGD